MMHTCDECGQSFCYDPKHHECVDPADRECDKAAFVSRTGRYRESWVDESMRKVGAR